MNYCLDEACARPRGRAIVPAADRVPPHRCRVAWHHITYDTDPQLYHECRR